MCLIDVVILKEIEQWEGYYYYVVQKFFKSGAKKKNWAIFRSIYLVYH